ncbi:MAG: tRNA (adenosine(37)-N6)-threonylcarbamoyltransferase complex dimerization subunit type 1 TsaB [Alphaproteobacteria bacterium]|nr:tRNA (adenosine(37)-N6)-threonylcarbamoyltransferase complex dimerization subunit type 1 TsaB [Alphaproteobacteria bacterium]
MYTLAFDTTAAACSIALFNEEQCLDVFRQEMDFGQAETLLPEIDRMLKRHQIEFKQITLLVVCVGPGSFTGVRSSISAARAFGLACPQLEVLGVNAFEAYIRTLAWTPEQIAQVNAVVIETKREDFYYQLFDEHLKPISAPSAANRDDIIAALRQKKITFLGDGVERFLNSKTGLSLHAIIPSQELDIKELALCGLNKYRKKEHNYPKPLYLRAPDVCIKG